MNKNLRCIMLVDDDPDDNFFHEREIKKTGSVNTVITMNSAAEALAYLKSKSDKTPHPDLIFLDINMPKMNGWEFLEEYNKLDKELKSLAIIIMLSTSQNPDDKVKAEKWNFVTDFLSKPLTAEVMKEIIDEYFNQQ